MKPVVTVPPAQAEALFDAHYDAQGDLRDDCLADLCRMDRAKGQPWQGDDGDEFHIITHPLNTNSLNRRVPLPAPSFGRVP